MATTAVAPGAALGAASHGLRHQQLNTRLASEALRALVAAGRDSRNSATTERPTRPGLPPPTSGPEPAEHHLTERSRRAIPAPGP